MRKPLNEYTVYLPNLEVGIRADDCLQVDDTVVFRRIGNGGQKVTVAQFCDIQGWTSRRLKDDAGADGAEDEVPQSRETMT